MGTMVTIGKENMPAYLAMPVGEARVPGVLVIHEAFGLRPEITAHADRLAEAGFAALAPSLFFRGGLRCLVATMRALSHGEGDAFSDISTARTWLLAQPRVTGKVGIIGFCMGGGFALATAPKGWFAAAAPNYGNLPRNPAEALKGSCPVVASYGGKDRMQKGAAATLEAVLTELGVPHDVKEYPEATHGFMNSRSGKVGKVTALMGLRFDQEAAEDAWARIIPFFREHLMEKDESRV